MGEQLQCEMILRTVEEELKLVEWFVETWGMEDMRYRPGSCSARKLLFNLERMSYFPSLGFMTHWWNKGIELTKFC